MEEDLEDARERYFWGLILKGIWTSLILLFVFGVLSSLTVLLDWGKYLLLCFVGLLAGIFISAGIAGSSRNRDLTALILGAVIFPIWAAYLGSVAVRSQADFSAYSASLSPFFAYATGTVLGGLLIAKIWQKKPGGPELEEEEEFPETTGVTPPREKPTAHAVRETIKQTAKAEEAKV